MKIKTITITGENCKNYQKVNTTLTFELEENENELDAIQYAQGLILTSNLNYLANSEAAIPASTFEGKPAEKKNVEEIPKDKRPTEKQIEILKKHNVEVPPTKARASELIRQIIENDKK